MSWTNDAQSDTCPVCGLAASDATQHRDGGKWVAAYVCPLEHLWQVTWLAPGVA